MSISDPMAIEAQRRRDALLDLEDGDLHRRSSRMTPTEINRRVAKICGLPVAKGVGRRTLLCKRLHRDALVGQFTPSCFKRQIVHFDPFHDVSDAMWAAERTGLLKRHYLCQGSGASLWYVTAKPSGETEEVVEECGETASNAICNAILALAGVTA